MASTEPTELPLPLETRVEADGADAAAPRDLRAELGGSTLLLADMRTAFILANAARHRAIERLFGVTPDQQNLVTLIAAVMLANAVYTRAERLLRSGPTPSLADGLFGVASAREALSALAGTPSEETPMLGTLISTAVIAGTAGPVVVKAMRRARASSHRATVGFHHRYGYLVDPGHWRSRRARRHEAESADRAAQAQTVAGA